MANDKNNSQYQRTENDTKYVKALKGALRVADMLGLNESTKDKNFNRHYRENLYRAVDPTSAYPQNVFDAYTYYKLAQNAKNDTSLLKKRRERDDRTADAAWAKRLGLEYDKNYLPDNNDGSSRLPRNLESQIPVDTTFFKNRIKANEDLINYYNKTYGSIPSNKQEAIELGLKYDKQTLEALRHTFATGEPVVVNEHGYIDREWIKDGNTNLTPSPLNTLQNYTIQYDKNNNRMNYWDIYDFNLFEDFVPGKSFEIRGSVPIRKQTKGSLKEGGKFNATLSNNTKTYVSKKWNSSADNITKNTPILVRSKKNINSIIW